MMDGRVKTLHPKVHGGLLAIRDNKEHADAMKAHGIAPIDLLVVNLYPFEATVDKGAGYEDCIENIDIGGPAMIRAAAKNHDDVAVVVEAQDYQAVLDELAANKGATTLALRRRLAAKAYARTAAYDAAISNWFARELKNDAPDFRAFGGRLIQSLALWREPASDRGVLCDARQAPGRCQRAAIAGQGTVLQQHQRYRCRLRMHRRVRCQAHRGLRHRQACQPLRRRRGSRSVSGLSQGAGLRLDVGVWRHRRRQPHARCRSRPRHHRNLHRSDHRAGCDGRGHRDHRERRRTSGCCSPAACPTRAPWA